MIRIGIDPDSEKHGVAIYVSGGLSKLKSMTLIEIYEKLEFMNSSYLGSIEVHIEDVNGVSASFTARDKKENINVKLKIASHMGRCKQAQIELERVFEYFGVKVVKHKISKNWKDASGKKQFEMVTGWTGRSNEDTRSAAYFGFLGHKNGIKKIN